MACSREKPFGIVIAARDELEAWIAEQVAAGRMRRKRDGSVVAVR